MRDGLRYGTALAALAAVAALLLTGCTSGGEAAAGGHPTAAPTVPPTSARPADDPPCGATPESYRPAGALPQPGRMPAKSTMAAIVARGRLIAGVDQNSYLFGYRDPLTGQLDGYEIQLLKRISTALFGSPDHIEFRTVTSAQRIPVLLQKDPVDIVIDSMTVNCRRWKSVAFSSDYMDAGQRVLVPKRSTARSVADLAGRKVCAASGTTSIDTLKGLKDHPVVPVGVKDWTDCLMLMQLGQVDAVSTDDTILIGLQRQDPNTRLIGPRFTAEPHGIAMQPGQIDFVRFVNAVLERMRQDGSLQRLAQTWLGDGTTFGPPPAVYRD
ncbi:glutamate ABC transporter substrate-binding protein [Actinacidiphila paucisporea]|uniref:Amino acid ABC transporter substrate-binding protein, PAAT family n=1 Tax=Actinacidiphila paucisporea TaxID=310782 RepID=A0A1M7J7I6_9ACTN|nr:glutamate ABC transporter substrate-binding protein [Actinacidiphila paucisporea]SHM48898.1 amino acid ABC transporter substrate-binding protein, PAAT family [Actinacidiphila paucisporea]